MIISFCSRLYDPVGSILLRAWGSSVIDDFSRRVTRVATLDGNSALIDNGFSSADAEFRIRARLTREQEQHLRYLAAIHPRLSVATRYGVYEGVISQIIVDPSSGVHDIQFLVAKQLTE
jgi:hypothetical protein